MEARYKLGPLIQQDGYTARDLFKVNENSPTYQSEIIAQIHIRDIDGQAVITTPNSTASVTAENYNDAVSFLKSLLGVRRVRTTTLE